MRPAFPELVGASFPAVDSVIYVRRIDSSNRLARHILDEYVREDLELSNVLVIALEQSEGRGRQGRIWSSPAGEGLYASLLIPDVADPSRLPLMVPLALCRVLNRYLAGRCRIKWPNDLMVGKSKIGGVLLEVPYRGQKTPAVVIGFGVNLHTGPTSLEGAISMADELGERCPSLGEMASDLVASLCEMVYDTPDRSELVASYRDLLVHTEGDPMKCRIGDEVLSGAFSGIDETGRLILDEGGSKRHLSAAEVFD